METMRKPASITFEHDSITVEGVRLALDIIPQILYELTHPDPRKTFRLERVGDVINVHVNITEGVEGSKITTVGQV